MNSTTSSTPTKLESPMSQPQQQPQSSSLLSEMKARLTEEQLEVVKTIEAGDNVCCLAVAGSGKTTTSLAAAVAFLDKYPRNEVYLLTYNTMLKDETRAKVREMRQPYASRITVDSYHASASRFFECGSNLGGLLLYAQQQAKPKRYIPPYGLVIVDEAQDLNAEMYGYLKHFLQALRDQDMSSRSVASRKINQEPINRSGSNAENLNDRGDPFFVTLPQMMILGDPFQRIYGNMRHATVEYMYNNQKHFIEPKLVKQKTFVNLKLSICFRISHEMAEWIGLFLNPTKLKTRYRAWWDRNGNGERVTSWWGATGIRADPRRPRDPTSFEFIQANFNDYSRVTGAVKDAMTEFNNTQMAVLSRQVKGLSETHPTSIIIREVGEKDWFVDQSDKEIDPSEILLRNKYRVSSVHKFKGLERDAIIVLSVDAFAERLASNAEDPLELYNVFYVACTRARKRLIVVQWGNPYATMDPKNLEVPTSSRSRMLEVTVLLAYAGFDPILSILGPQTVSRHIWHQYPPCQKVTTIVPGRTKDTFEDVSAVIGVAMELRFAQQAYGVVEFPPLIDNLTGEYLTPIEAKRAYGKEFCTRYHTLSIEGRSGGARTWGWATLCEAAVIMAVIVNRSFHLFRQVTHFPDWVEPARLDAIFSQLVSMLYEILVCRTLPMSTVVTAPSWLGLQNIYSQQQNQQFASSFSHLNPAHLSSPSFYNKDDDDNISVSALGFGGQQQLNDEGWRGDCFHSDNSTSIMMATSSQPSCSSSPLTAAHTHSHSHFNSHVHVPSSSSATAFPNFISPYAAYLSVSDRFQHHQNQQHQHQPTSPFSLSCGAEGDFSTSSNVWGGDEPHQAAARCPKCDSMSEREKLMQVIGMADPQKENEYQSQNFGSFPSSPPPSRNGASVGGCEPHLKDGDEEDDLNFAMPHLGSNGKALTGWAFFSSASRKKQNFSAGSKTAAYMQQQQTDANKDDDDKEEKELKTSELLLQDLLQYPFANPWFTAGVGIEGLVDFLHYEYENGAEIESGEDDTDEKGTKESRKDGNGRNVSGEEKEIENENERSGEGSSHSNAVDTIKSSGAVGDHKEDNGNGGSACGEVVSDMYAVSKVEEEKHNKEEEKKKDDNAKDHPASLLISDGTDECDVTGKKEKSGPSSPSQVGIFHHEIDNDNTSLKGKINGVKEEERFGEEKKNNEGDVVATLIEEIKKETNGNSEPKKVEKNKNNLPRRVRMATIVELKMTKIESDEHVTQLALYGALFMLLRMGYDAGDEIIMEKDTRAGGNVEERTTTSMKNKSAGASVPPLLALSASSQCYSPTNLLSQSSRSALPASPISNSTSTAPHVLLPPVVTPTAVNGLVSTTSTPFASNNTSHSSLYTGAVLAKDRHSTVRRLQLLLVYPQLGITRRVFVHMGPYEYVYRMARRKTNLPFEIDLFKKEVEIKRRATWEKMAKADGKINADGSVGGEFSSINNQAMTVVTLPKNLGELSRSELENLVTKQHTHFTRENAELRQEILRLKASMATARLSAIAPSSIEKCPANGPNSEKDRLINYAASITISQMHHSPLMPQETHGHGSVYSTVGKEDDERELLLFQGVTDAPKGPTAESKALLPQREEGKTPCEEDEEQKLLLQGDYNSAFDEVKVKIEEEEEAKKRNKGGHEKMVSDDDDNNNNNAKGEYLGNEISKGKRARAAKRQRGQECHSSNNSNNNKTEDAHLVTLLCDYFSSDDNNSFPSSQSDGGGIRYVEKLGKGRLSRGKGSRPECPLTLETDEEEE